MDKIETYLRARLWERSTWLGVGAAITGAAALPPPWSWLFVIVGTIAAIVPERRSAS